MKGPADQRKDNYRDRAFAVRSRRLIFLICLLPGFCIFFPGCAPEKRELTGSSGRILELLVVYDSPSTSVLTQAAVNEVFSSPQPGLNQSEACFDLTQIRQRDFTLLFHSFHSIFRIIIDPATAKEGILQHQDVWAKPQLLLSLYARSDSSAAHLIRRNILALREVFYETEYRKIAQTFAEKPSVAVVDSLKRKYGIQMVLPECFYIAASRDNTLWLRCRDEEKETGMLVSVLPFTDTLVFSRAGYFRLCDSLAGAMVPGSNPGSCMRLSMAVEPQLKQTAIDSVFALEMRGLWETRHDFMGGPFLAYLIAEPGNQKLLLLYAYGYRPNEPKRDLIMQMEAIMHSLRFAKQGSPNTH